MRAIAVRLCSAVLAEADAGIKHNVLPRDPGTCGEIERAEKNAAISV